ncbi:hypothetical protein ACFQY9_07975 [Microvirga aerilata]|uniref:hypothetical protein n=1 Tax=Microvirga aerilata TaxID=670292 RepID=UPI00362B956B
MPAAPLIRKLEQFDRISDAERRLLEQAVVRQRAAAKGRTWRGRGTVPPRASS